MYLKGDYYLQFLENYKEELSINKEMEKYLFNES